MSTDIKVSASTGDTGCSIQDAQCRKLTEVCMKQAARLEQMHDDLDKAKQSEQAARKELERSRQTLEQERAEFGDKVEQMAAFQAALQRENDLLLEELISVLGRTKALRAEMVWLQRFLPAADRTLTSHIGSGSTSKPLQNGAWQGCGPATGLSSPSTPQVIPPAALAGVWRQTSFSGDPSVPVRRASEVNERNPPEAAAFSACRPALAHQQRSPVFV
mmetsp:Transcript_12165/g.29053  ORF Transcript_12165/g.29053 Transcript_12165/m.29053 type:complete len:218 (-) Transcript_12165:8-661(-)